MTKRKPREALTRDRIVAAAADLIDREGLEALSARRLAGELGCEAMSLYHHVGNMSELLNDVIDQALGQLPLPQPDSRLARRQLRQMATAFLELARSRPHVFRAVSTRRWRTRAELDFQLRMIEILVSAGLSPRAALRAARTLIVYLNGAGLAIAARMFDDTVPAPESVPPWARGFLKLSNPASFSKDMAWGLDAVLKSLARD